MNEPYSEYEVKKVPNDVIRLAPFYICTCWSIRFHLLSGLTAYRASGKRGTMSRNVFYHFVVSYTMRTPRVP